MYQKSVLWAVIPARSGSKGFPDKNIYPLNGIPLLAHSIIFAKSLPFVTKIVLSTDSQVYAKIGQKFGACVPFLRSKSAANDTAMEEDILWDIRKQCEIVNLELPNQILWLRPTHPLRDLEAFSRGYNKFISGDYSSVCLVTPEDPRIFTLKGEYLSNVTDFKGKSMMRRQDCPPAYRIFHGEYFKFPKRYEVSFLGKKIGYEAMPRECRFDIDNKEDIEYLNFILSKGSDETKLLQYLNGVV